MCSFILSNFSVDNTEKMLPSFTNYFTLPLLSLIPSIEGISFYFCGVFHNKVSDSDLHFLFLIFQNRHEGIENIKEKLSLFLCQNIW